MAYKRDLTYELVNVKRFGVHTRYLTNLPWNLTSIKVNETATRRIVNTLNHNGQCSQQTMAKMV